MEVSDTSYSTNIELYCQDLTFVFQASQCVKHSERLVQMLLWLYFFDATPFLVFVFETVQNTLCFTPAKILRKIQITRCSSGFQTARRRNTGKRNTITEEMDQGRVHK